MIAGTIYPVVESSRSVQTADVAEVYHKHTLVLFFIQLDTLLSSLLNKMLSVDRPAPSVSRCCLTRFKVYKG